MLSLKGKLTDEGDGTATIDVDGHGKGTLTTYEGNIFSVIGAMAEDDAKAIADEVASAEDAGKPDSVSKSDTTA